MTSAVRFRRAGCVPVTVLAGLALLGCGDRMRTIVVTNALPVVSITAAPIDTNVACSPNAVRSCYSLTINWVGYDPDGRVDHYLIAVDPPSTPGADTTWRITRNNEERLLFTSTRDVPRRSTNDPPIAKDFHVFVIKAVDNRRTPGPVAARAFFSFTQAPDVFIIDPLPSTLVTPTLPPSIRVHWTGTDADGVFNTRPVRYKYILLNQSSEYPFDMAVRFPDSLRAHYAPGFAGWDSVGGDTTTVQFTNLTPDQEYLFVVVGFDEAGAYSPIFRLDKNMFYFRVGFAGQLGPKITIFNEYFEREWRGSYCPCASAEFLIEVPAARQVTFNWRATTTPGVNLRHFRWALDIADVFDQTPRAGADDLARWSSPSLNTTSATVGPFEGGIDPPEEHRFYVEAEDNVGLRSLAIVRFQVVRSSLTQGRLLIVKDMRLLVDGIPRGQTCTAPPPAGFWPTQAELDTFLFARGGVPWRCYPEGTLTTPGLFSGYAYDTIGTRTGKMDLGVRLATLGRYEAVIWIVDGLSANNTLDGNNPLDPMTSLRYMSGPGRFNTLAAYVKQGGKVWLTGGGGGFATSMPWNDPTNDVPFIKFSSTSTRRELAPGRFMYDIAHWQSEFRVNSEPVPMRRYLGRFEGRPPDPAQPHTSYLGELPAALEFKTAASDPLPPNGRGGTRRSSEFYQTTSRIELLQLANRVVENLADDPDTVIEASTLDTLYRVTGGSTPTRFENPYNVVMTYYHGPSVPQGFLYTGFNMWTFKRSQCRALVDFVLRRVWRMSPATAASRTTAFGEAHPRSGRRSRPIEAPPASAPRARPASGPAAVRD